MTERACKAVDVEFSKGVLAKMARQRIGRPDKRNRDLKDYSGMLSPLPPNSDGKSFNFGKPSFIGNTVSA